MPYNIAFDVSHKPRGKIDENYTELRDFLNENDFVCYNFLEIPITQESLRTYDILVFVCPDFSKLSNQEIMEITNWVKDDGGGLLLLSHAGGDKGRSSNLSELSEQFGLSFENDQVLDEMSNLGMENLPVITAAHFIPPHPITNGINELCYRAGCSLTVLGGAISIISSNESSEPFSVPLMCASEPDNGRVCAMGSYEMFRDRTGGGFQQGEHSDLAKNIFKWLVSDHRMEITEQGTIHKVTATSPQTPMITPTQTAETYSSPYSSDFGVQEIRPVDASLEFSSKEELISLLKTYINQINTLKYNIEHLMKSISTSALFEDDVGTTVPVDIQAENTYQKESYSDYTKYPDYADDEVETYNKGENSYYDQEEKSFTSLPQRPDGYVQPLNGVEEVQPQSDDYFVGLEPVEYKKRDTVERISNVSLSDIKKPSKIKNESVKKATPVEKQISGEKSEEILSLESKIGSIHNLINFIEKKYKSGKLDEKSYKKQIRKLQKDLDQSKKRMDEIQS